MQHQFGTLIWPRTGENTAAISDVCQGGAPDMDVGCIGLGWVENFPVLMGWVGLGLSTHMVIFFVNLTIYTYLSLSTADPTMINVGFLLLNPLLPDGGASGAPPPSVTQ